MTAALPLSVSPLSRRRSERSTVAVDGGGALSGASTAERTREEAVRLHRRAAKTKEARVKRRRREKTIGFTAEGRVGGREVMAAVKRTTKPTWERTSSAGLRRWRQLKGADCCTHWTA